MGIPKEFDQGALSLIMDSATDAIITIDSNARLVLFNAAAEGMFQFSAAEALGQPLTRFISAWVPEDQRKDEALERAGLRGAQVGALRSVTGLRAGGREFPAEVSMSQVEVGGRVYYTAILRDISERRRSEEALREASQRLALAVETARLGTYERDLLTNEVRLNDACREILGLPAGPPPPDIAPRSAHPEDKERVLAEVARAFNSALREVCAAEFRILRPDGTIRWVAGRGRVVFDESVGPAQPLKFLGVLLDVTERKFVEEELLRAKQELTRINAELEQRVRERTMELQEMIAQLEHMSYSMIHDMRSPLRAIQSFAELLELDRQTRLSEEAQQMVARMRKASNRMDQLLTGALNYNDALRRKQMSVGPVNVLRLLRDVLASYPEFQPPTAVVTLEGEFPWVTGNEAGLAQCFAELIRNGIKFVQPGKVPRMRIWAESSPPLQETQAGLPSPKVDAPATDPLHDFGKRVRLYFEDNGTGIPAAWRVRVFDLFQRSHGAEYPGTGVGLALVRKVIEDMGGQVGVESEEGVGSCFWLEVPRQAPPG